MDVYSICGVDLVACQWEIDSVNKAALFVAFIVMNFHLYCFWNYPS